MSKAQRIKQNKIEQMKKTYRPTKEELFEGVDKKGKMILGIISKKTLLEDIKRDKVEAASCEKVMGTRAIIAGVKNVDTKDVDNKEVFKYMEYAVKVLEETADIIKKMEIKQVEELTWDNSPIYNVMNVIGENEDCIIKETLRRALLSKYNNKLASLKAALENNVE